jgi:hypothetical protein
MWDSIWPYVGTTCLIAGPDLVRRTVDPDLFLEFMTGGLRDQFRATAAALGNPLHAPDRLDPDGRHRVNQMFCFEPIWQAAVEKWLAVSAHVLMDPSGFTGRQAQPGCAREIDLIVAHAPLSRVTFLFDDATNRDAFDCVFEEALAQMPTHSPNARGPLAVRVFETSGRDHACVARTIKSIEWPERIGADEGGSRDAPIVRVDAR